MAQFSKRLRLDLADVFSRNGENLSNFFQGVLASIVQTKAQPDDPLLARRQRPKYGRNLIP